MLAKSTPARYFTPTPSLIVHNGVILWSPSRDARAWLSDMLTARNSTFLGVLTTLGLLLAGWALVLGVMLLTGVLVTRVLDNRWPLSGEDSVNRELVSIRTPAGNDVTWLFSALGNTWVVIGVCTVAVIVLRVVLDRWFESIFVAVCTIGQSVVFLFTTLLIDRERPNVPRLDDSPPTSSFPSGHTSAALTLYLALTLVVQQRVRRRWVRWAATAGLLLIPLAVATGRLYRGMHHPTDIAGSAINAVLVLLVTGWVLHRTTSPDDGRATASVPETASESGTRPA